MNLTLVVTALVRCEIQLIDLIDFVINRLIILLVCFSYNFNYQTRLDFNLSDEIHTKKLANARSDRINKVYL